MSSKKNKSVNIKKYKRKRELNLGIFLFAIVFIYLLVTVISYFGRDNISVYEVREGSIVRDNSYTGLIIREETAVNADAAGYVSYYQNENSKVKAGMNIYALSGEMLNTESALPEDTKAAAVSPEVQSAITLQLQSFNENYDSDDFSAVYSLKNEINTSLQDTYSVTRTQQLDAVIAASGTEATSYTAPRDGIVAFTVDGYEGLTKDTFTEENFATTEYESTVLSDQMQISQGDPVYRLITNEEWSVIVPLEKETAESLIADEVSSIRVRVDKDSETMWADFSIIERDGNYYGCLDFDNSMIRYAEDRFLNVELILEDESGLKIPKSSVVEEKFFVVPGEYLTTGGNSSSDGVMVRDDDGSVEFTPVTIYDNSDDGEICISRDDLTEGSTIVKPDSNETYTIGKTKSLQGVYNINRGYAVFKKVAILCENDEYYVIQEGVNYSLSNYDHIVQNGSSVSSDEVVFQ
nr:HlyD family efflux transporter periplasmic adaptor subunit [uncultured Mediterraneibacter sp.]